MMTTIRISLLIDQLDATELKQTRADIPLDRRFHLIYEIHQKRRRAPKPNEM